MEDLVVKVEVVKVVNGDVLDNVLGIVLVVVVEAVVVVTIEVIVLVVLVEKVVVLKVAGVVGVVVTAVKPAEVEVEMLGVEKALYDFGKVVRVADLVTGAVIWLVEVVIGVVGLVVGSIRIASLVIDVEI